LQGALAIFFAALKDKTMNSKSESRTVTGNLYDIQAETYNGLSGFYDPVALLKECNGDASEAARQIVDGAIDVGMITNADVIWNAPDNVVRKMDCYQLIKGYLERI
jgi:hypothetical protein